MIKKLSVIELEQIAFQLAMELMTFNEPIPDFTTRFSNILESCLLTPFQTFVKKPLYKGLTGKAAIMFYLLVKNHPFQNGNKRIAITALLTFLYKNNKWIKTDSKEFYNFSIWVAQSPRQFQAETVMAIEKFIKSHLVSLK